MPIEIKMPALSPTMETGTLGKWLVSEGDVVRSGDIIAEIETDKATMEFEAVDDGRIAKILVPAGSDEVAVGTVLALIGDGTDDSGAAPAIPAQQPDPPSLPALDSPPRARLADKVKISPLAARIANVKGIDLAALSGTGPYGRIVKADLGLSPAPATTAVTSRAPRAEVLPSDVPFTAIPHTTMRRTIARRLTEAKQTTPHFYLTVRCRLDALLALRAELNAGRDTALPKLSVNDMLIKAMAIAMDAVPDVNVQFGADATYRFDRVDISMAVAIDGGLVTPVIRDVGALSLSAIADRSRDFAERARSGMLKPEDYTGGTASISNLGMFGIDAMIPVINPPQAMILGIGAGIEQPWKVDGGIALATIMAATVSFDHRAIDGATGARFMAAFRELVENPLRILV